MTLTALLTRLDALQARLDARRRAEAAGQLALDLGGAPAAGKGPGGGEQCGGSWIDPNKDCHKGKSGAPIDPGGAPIDPPDDTRRRRPVEPILFNPPLQGPSGAHLLAYEWQWMMDSFQDSHGEEQLKRVSNWELSEQNSETGRRVVHQFKVRKPDGTTALVSSETAVKILGFATPDQKAGFRQIRSMAQTIARLEMEKAQLEQEHKRIGAIYAEIEKQTPPEPQISRNEYGRGLEWVMPGSDHAIPAKVLPRRVGIAPRAASTPEEAHLMPHERSTLLSHWQAARVAERLGRSRMPTRGSFNGDMHYQKQELDKRIAKARKRLEQQAASKAGRADSALGVDRIDSLLTRLDAFSSRLRRGTGDRHPLGAHAVPEAARPLARLGIVSRGQVHRAGGTGHQRPVSRQDQATGEGDGQPCGDGFISAKYQCRIGINRARSADTNVLLEADSETAGDIKRAIQEYSNRPDRIRRMQARIAIQDGLRVSTYGYTQDEKLSRLALDKESLQAVRRQAELLEHYIEKAPKYDGEVFRGMRFGSSKEAETFIEDLQTCHVASVDSWSTSSKIGAEFAGVDEPRSYQRAAVLLKQQNQHGASIKRYSSIQDEEEVLQPSGIRYKVLSIKERVEGSLASPLTIYEVEVEAVEHRPMRRKVDEELDLRIDSLLARIDALKRRCSTGYSCGSACISVKKECRNQPTATTSRERISRLEQLAKGQIKPRGIGNPKPEEARALADKLRTERAEQQAVVKAERERRKAAAAKEGKRQPSVKVLLRRAKPGGEHGPDGHWYPGGAWMSEGRYVGAKPLNGQGQGDARDQKEKPKDGQEQRVVRPKRPSFPERPLKPKGEGLPRPTGLKKMAMKNDEEFFGDDGYILYPRREGRPGLVGTLFEAAVIQRMTTDELKWATEQIRQKVQASGDQELRQWFDDTQADIDDDIARFEGPEGFAEYGRGWARTQLIGVDAERYIAGRRFMSASRALSGNISPAQKRREERYRDPRFEDWIVPEQDEYDRWVWGLNNIFRAVRIRRGRA